MPIEYLLQTSLTLGEVALVTLGGTLSFTLGELFLLSTPLRDGILDYNSLIVAVASSIISVNSFNCFIALFVDVPGSNSVTGVLLCTSLVRFSITTNSLSAVI